MKQSFSGNPRDLCVCNLQPVCGVCVWKRREEEEEMCVEERCVVGVCGEALACACVSVLKILTSPHKILTSPHKILTVSLRPHLQLFGDRI